MENNKYLHKLLGTGKASKPDANNRIRKTAEKYSLTVQLIFSVSKIKRSSIPSLPHTPAGPQPRGRNLQCHRGHLPDSTGSAGIGRQTLGRGG